MGGLDDPRGAETGGPTHDDFAWDTGGASPGKGETPPDQEEEESGQRTALLRLAHGGWPRRGANFALARRACRDQRTALLRLAHEGWPRRRADLAPTGGACRDQRTAILCSAREDLPCRKVFFVCM